MNVKDVEYITDTSGILKKQIKPNFRSLGKKLGKQMKAASQVISGFDQDVIRQIEQDGIYKMEIEGEVFELALDDFIITSEDIPGWQVASEGGVTVALDTNLNDDLLAEGTARELVNRIQNLRKDKSFEVTDRIRIALEGHESVVPAVEKFGGYIQNEVLATDLNLVADLRTGDEIEIDEVSMRIAIEKVG